MIPSAITSRKRATRLCTITSPLCQAWAIHPEKGVALAQDLLCALVLGLALAQAAGAMTPIMWLLMIAGRARSPSMGIHTSRTTMTDIIIARTRTIPYLPPSPLQWQRKISGPTNRESHQQRIHVSHLMSLLQIGN
jgi:hypothetical protein